MGTADTVRLLLDPIYLDLVHRSNVYFCIGMLGNNVGPASSSDDPYVDGEAAFKII
jgi:hypothetical protein